VVLINFAATDTLNLLCQLPDCRFLTVKTVLDEITYENLRNSVSRLIEEGILEVVATGVSPDEEIAFIEKYFRKPVGEAVALLAAQSREATIATDEKKARRIAKELHIKVTGTIGLLKRMISAGIINAKQALGLIKEMEEKASYWPPKNFQNYLLRS